MNRSTSHVPILLFCTFALVGTQSCKSSDDLDLMLADTGKVDAGPQDSELAKSSPSSGVGPLASGSADSGSVGAEPGAGEEGSGATCSGGAVACTSASDCPIPKSKCQIAVCEQSCCGTTDAPVGTTCSDDGGILCDGAGACVGCLSDADCAGPTCHNDTFMPASTCTSNTCVAGEPETCAAPKRMCDPAQGCIACMTDSDCAPASCNGNVHTPAQACQAGTCVESAPTTCPGLCTADSGCVRCNTNADCAPYTAAGLFVCDTSTGACVSPP